MAVTFRRRGGESSSREVMVAWHRYLTAIRVCPAEVYEETEAEAWKHLVDELDSIGSADSGAAPRPLEGSPAR